MSKLIFLPDVHIRAARNGAPTGHDVKTLAAVNKYIVDFQPDRIVIAGDTLDLPYFSDYEKVPIKEAVEYYEEDIEIAKQYIDFWRGTAKNLDVIQGNHDYRAERVLRENPHLKKILNVERDLGLKPTGRAKFIRFWEDSSRLVRVGKAAFGHGLYTNTYHAAKHASRFPGINFFYGHTHDIQSFDPVTFGHGGNNTAQSMGLLGRYDQPWLRNAPTNWQQAFGVFHFGKGGFFQHYTVRIFNNRFVSPEGVEYKR